MLQICAVDFTVANILLPLINECRKEYDVHVACAPGPDSQRLAQEGYEFRYIAFSRGLNVLAHWRAFWALVRLMYRERYDIVHTHTPVAAVLGRLAGKLAGVPTIVNTVHGFYFHEHMQPVLRCVAVLVERLVGLVTTFSIFVSGEDHSTALRLRICCDSNAKYIPNGVDRVRFDSQRTDLKMAARQVRQNLGLKSEDIVLGIVARLVAEKGILELLRAFEEVQENHPNLHLVLVGDALASDRDGVRTEIERALKNPSFGSRIHWLGYRRDVESVLGAMDIFALPSYREGMPLSVLEAMSMGLPVIATDVRGCREVVVAGSTGLLVPHRSVPSLAQAVSRLANDAELRTAFGRAGLQRARTHFDLEISLNRTLEVYKALQG